MFISKILRERFSIAPSTIGPRRRNRIRPAVPSVHSHRSLRFEPLEIRQLLSVTPAGIEFRVNTYTTGAQQLGYEEPRAIASDGAGNFVVAWSSFGQDGSGYGIYAQRYSPAGAPVGGEFRVNTFTTGDQTSPEIAMNAAGDCVITWSSYGQDGDRHGTYAQRYNPAGVAQGSEFRANVYTTREQDLPTVAMDAQGNFVIAWNSWLQDGSSFGVYARRFDSTGTALSGEFRVSTYTANNQWLPQIAMNAAGAFVVTWSTTLLDGDRYGVYAQRYNSSGTVAGSEFKVHTYTFHDQELSSVAMESDGDFLVAWQSYTEDGSGWGIYAQRFDASGSKQGPEFRVNTTTTNYQEKAGIALDADGDYVITWEGRSQAGGQSWDIYAQKFNAADVPQGSEFRVNTYTTDDQRFPFVSMDADGDFVVAWTSTSQDGSGNGIYAQRFDSHRVGTTTSLGASANPSPVGQSVTLTASPTANSSGVGPVGGTVTFYDGNTVLGSGTFPQSTTWSTVANMPTARQGLGVAAGPDGRIYAIAGDYGAGVRSNVVEAYNPNTNSWATVASVTPARGYLAAATGVDGLIYAIGGENGSTVVGTVEAYSTSSNTWTSVASMPTARRSLGVATGPDGRIYAIGGHGGGPLNKVEIYNPSINSWSNGANMPTPRSGLAVVTGLDGCLYAIGGFDGSALNTVEKFDPSTNSWTTLANMPTARHNPAAAVGPDGRIYVTAGMLPSVLTDVVEVYDPGTNTWSTVATAPTARETAGAAIGVDGRIYVIGGNNVGGAVNIVEALNFSGTSVALSTSSLAVGTHTITAVYSGNSNYLSSTSAPLALVVNDPPPRVTGIYSADAAGTARIVAIPQNGHEISNISKLVVVFSENMATTGLANIKSAHNWRIERNGVDVTSQLSGITFGFNATTSRYEAVLSLSSPLAAGSYELTVRSSLTDLTGNRLDGDSDGSAFGEDYLHRFTISAPTAAGSEFQVNTYTTGRQLYYQNGPRSIAMDDAGDFVVVWTGEFNGGILYDIYAQRYNAAGVPQGSEFRVNTLTATRQRYANVAMDADGDFVVTWNGAGGVGVYNIYAQRYNAAGVPQGSEFRVNTYTTDTQTFSTVEMNANGDFVVAWSSNNQDGSSYGIYAQRFNAAGVPQGTEFRVNTYTLDSQRDPSVGMDDAGNFVVTWFGRNNNLDSSDFGIYAQRYDSTGQALGSEFQVNNYTTGVQNYPQIAMTPTGEFVIAWISGNDGSLSSVSGRRYDASGAPLGSEFLINQYTTGHQYQPRLAMHSSGSFVVAFQQDGPDGSASGVFARQYDPFGNPETNVFQVNSYTADDQKLPHVAIDATGNYAVVWTSLQDGDNLGIYGQRFAAASVVTSVKIVGDSSDIEPGERLAQTISTGSNLAVTFSRDMSQAGGAGGANSVTNPANWMLTWNGLDISINTIGSVSYTGTTATLNLISPLPDGDYVLTAKATINDADGRALDGDGNGTAGGNFSRAFSIQQPAAVGSDFVVNSYTTNEQSEPSIAMNRQGDYVITWTSQAQDGSSFGVFGQRYNAAGLRQGSEFRVNTYTSNGQSVASVAMDSSGNFVVAWNGRYQDGSMYGIFAQRYNAAGVPQGSEFRVNNFTTNTQILPTIAMDADGDFVIGWSSNTQDGNLSGIFARRYDAFGNPQGTEFQVNNYTTSDQIFPQIAMDAAGNFVVAWHSSNQDGSGLGVYARRYNAAGVVQGSEFRVNTFTTGDQRVPAVAMSATGDFAITWISNSQDGDGYGVYAQRYNAAGVAQGSEFRVNTYTTGMQNGAYLAMDVDGDFVVTWNSLQDGGGHGIYAQRYSAAGIPQGSEFQVNTYTFSDQKNPRPAIDSDGDFVIAWSSGFQDGNNNAVAARRFIGAPPVQVVSMTPTYTGFEIDFNRDFDASVLNLFDQGGALGVADVTLTGATVGVVRGSVVVEPGSHKLTFIKSGGQLDPDVYTINLRASATGFVDAGSHLLDGNGDGVAGDDYLARFTITPPPTGPTVAIGDFTRGYGQPVNFPASSSTGIPITISNAVGIQSASFALVYDPSLLTITGATLGAGITGTVTLNTTLAGIARVTVSGTHLSSVPGLQTLVNLAATVPNSAPYSSKQILDLSSVQLVSISQAVIPAIDDDGIHIAAYFGDANGSQTYNSPDATLAQRIIVGTNTGLSAYQLADPYLIVDITGNGSVQSNDITLIQRAIVGTATTQIAAYPGLPLQSGGQLGGPDPIVSIPKDLQAGVGETIQVPVQISVTEPTGITLASLDLAIAYDSTRLELKSAQVGQLLIGFGLSVNSATPGLLKLSLTGSAPLALPHGLQGDLVMLDFAVLSSSATATPLNLLARSAAFETALYDDLGRALTLAPAPSDDPYDPVDGSVRTSPALWQRAVDDALTAEFGHEF